MGVTIKHFDKSKLSDFLNWIRDDIDEDDMKKLKGFLKERDDQIAELKKEIKTINNENEKLKKLIKEMLEEVSKKNQQERKRLGLKEGQFLLGGNIILNQIHYELEKLVNK